MLCVRAVAVLLGWCVIMAPGIVTAFPKTCHEVQMSGGIEGYHTIDPEQDDLDPISVFCNMSITPVTAVLHHNLEEWIYVSGYEETGSYNGQLLYDNGATVDQVRGLILASTQCTYFLHLRCVDIAESDIYWESYYGRVDEYEKLGGMFCQQETGEVKCKCGPLANGIDIGDAGNWPLFPLVSLRLGDTGGAWEYIYFQVGPLVCKQERTLSRWFTRKRGTRQNADVIGIESTRSVAQCGVKCTAKAQHCVGFNFQRGPPARCELTGVPHDAPNTNMVVDPAWDHYVIIP